MSPAVRFAAPSFVFAGADASKRDRTGLIGRPEGLHYICS
jgi:hypothetical protein